MISLVVLRPRDGLVVRRCGIRLQWTVLEAQRELGVFYLLFGLVSYCMYVISFRLGDLGVWVF